MLTIQPQKDPLRHTITNHLPAYTGLIKLLDDLGVPADAGRPAARPALRAALRAAGVNVGNAQLEEAIRARKQLPGAAAGSAGSPDSVSPPDAARLPPRRGQRAVGRHLPRALEMITRTARRRPSRRATRFPRAPGINEDQLALIAMLQDRAEKEARERAGHG